MTKKGPLSKAEKIYIESKHGEVTLENLCKELDRAKSLVRTHITKCKKEFKLVVTTRCENLVEKMRSTLEFGDRVYYHNHIML